jgi:hypothetical protein
VQASKLLGGGGGRNFCPCVAPAVGRGQWSYPSWPDADALADELLHWMCPLVMHSTTDALNAPSVMHTTDAAHTECRSHF